MKKVLCVLGLVAAVASPSAFAEGFNPYVIGGVSHNSGTASFSSVPMTGTFDETRTSGFFGVGAKVGAYDVQIGYTDLGKVKANGAEVTAYSIPVTVGRDMPVYKDVNIGAKVGAAFTESTTKVPFSSDVKTSSWYPTVGVYSTYSLTPQLKAIVSIDGYGLDQNGAKVTTVGNVGLKYSF